MLRHDIRVECGRVAADFDLEIAGSVTGVERTEQRNKRVHDGLATGQLGEFDPELPAGRPKIENAVVGERRCQRIGVAVIETEGEAMQRVCNFVPIVGQLRRSCSWAGV